MPIPNPRHITQIFELLCMSCHRSEAVRLNAHWVIGRRSWPRGDELPGLAFLDLLFFASVPAGPDFPCRTPHACTSRLLPSQPAGAQMLDASLHQNPSRFSLLGGRFTHFRIQSLHHRVYSTAQRGRRVVATGVFSSPFISMNLYLNSPSVRPSVRPRRSPRTTNNVLTLVHFSQPE